MVDIDSESFKWTEGITITKLLEQAGIVPRLGLVVIDGLSVDKKNWDSFKVKDRAAINTRPMLPGG